MTDLVPYSFEPEYGDVEDVSTSEEGDSEGGGGASDHADLEEERIGHSEWCTCGMCAAMPSAVECICCQEIDELNWKLHGLACITEHGNFSSVCLNEDVLRTAVVSMVDVRGDTITEPLTNRPAKLFFLETIKWITPEIVGCRD